MILSILLQFLVLACLMAWVITHLYDIRRELTEIRILLMEQPAPLPENKVVYHSPADEAKLEAEERRA